MIPLINLIPKDAPATCVVIKSSQSLCMFLAHLILEYFMKSAVVCKGKKLSPFTLYILGGSKVQSTFAVYFVLITNITMEKNLKHIFRCELTLVV